MKDKIRYNISVVVVEAELQQRFFCWRKEENVRLCKRRECKISEFVCKYIQYQSIFCRYSDILSIEKNVECSYNELYILLVCFVASFFVIQRKTFLSAGI